MRLKRLFLLGAIAFSSACVSQTDFDAYKLRIAADGNSLEAWAARADTNIIWLRQSVITLCPACSPPMPPPAPPPDGARVGHRVRWRFPTALRVRARWYRCPRTLAARHPPTAARCPSRSRSWRDRSRGGAHRLRTRQRTSPRRPQRTAPPRSASRRLLSAQARPPAPSTESSGRHASV